MVRFRHLVTTASVSILFLSCAGSRQAAVPAEAMELGPIDRSFMAKPEYGSFAAAYDSVQVSGDVVELIRLARADAEFLVFLGTWCSDSRREVPRFLKIADRAGIPDARVRLHGLDRASRRKDALADQYAIERVPTFIVLRGGREVGRIVEQPTGTLEGDLLTILAGTQNR